MKVKELKMILDGFDPDADVEIVEPNMNLLHIEKIKLMMAYATKVKQGGVIGLTEQDRASARPICTIVTRRLNRAA